MSEWESIEVELAKWDNFASNMRNDLEGHDQDLFDEGAAKIREDIVAGVKTYREALLLIMKGTVEELKKRAMNN